MPHSRRFSMPSLRWSHPFPDGGNARLFLMDVTHVGS